MTDSIENPHIEEHFKSTEVIRDIVIGMSDGLTVPFALAAGLSGAVANSHLIVTAGLAEIAAGSIAMGLGGYLAAKGDSEHYESERAREEKEAQEFPEKEVGEVDEILQTYGLNPEESAIMVTALQRNPQSWVDFMMRFELGLEEPNPKRALISASTIAGSYIVGGAVPLAPYIFIHQSQIALYWSVGFTLLALAIFGFVKGRVIGRSAIKSAVQTVSIGGLAATAAFILAKVLSK